jgi:molybdate transport system regulatory protein
MAGMKKTPLQLHSALGHDAADKRIEILRRIGVAGSISEAARGAGVSYKAAWQAIDTLSNLAGAALVERVVGGAGGGGARLTSAGNHLLAAAAALAAAREQVLARLGGGPAAPGLAALGLRTSMRNQLPCTVEAIVLRGGMQAVRLALPDGTAISSRVTRESAQLLGLHAGQPVLALCKATAVQVGIRAGAAPGSNLLPGRVTRLSRAAGGGEVALALDAGPQLVGFCGPASGLKPRGPAVAWVDEAAIVIAVS